MIQRKHFSHLPNAETLADALKREAKRNVPISKQDIHYPTFDLFLSWLRNIHINTEFFEYPHNWQEMINMGSQLREAVVSQTLEQVTMNDEQLLGILQEIEKYLGKEQIMPKHIDVMFVFGSQDLGRIRKAVSIGQTHFIQTMLIAGGARYDTKDTARLEAELFRDEALKLGFPKDKIVFESNSITVADNVRSGLNLLDSLHINYSNIVTMISWFAQRRAWVHLMKYTEDVDVICINSNPTSPELTPGSWYRHEIGINTIFGEYLKMKMAVMLNTA